MNFGRATSGPSTSHEAAGMMDRQDVQLSIGGPILRDRLGIRLTGRYLYEEGDDISRRLFMPSDS